MPKTKKNSWDTRQSGSDDADTVWIPKHRKSRQVKREMNLPLEEKQLDQRLTSLVSGESEWEDVNECPVCHKFFSRSAALICHIKQNHTYMLSKEHGEKSTLHSLKKEVMEWKNRFIKEKRQSMSSEVSFAGGSSGTDKDSGSANDTDDGELSDFQVIGGSVAKVGKQNFQSGIASSSILAFNNSNADLLDPDQSFCIVRQNSKKLVKKKAGRLRKCKVVTGNNNKNFKSPNKDSSLDFHSIDLSIENNSEEKTFSCYVCKSLFSSSSLLTYHHMRIHMTNDLHQCPYCGQVFYDTHSYETHYEDHVKDCRK